MSLEIAVVAGFDGSGGAGLTADGETARSLGATPRYVVTALTAQSDEEGFFVEATSEAMFRAQWAAAFADSKPQAIKVGMLPNLAIARALVSALEECPEIPVVYDPVLVASSGLALMEEDAIDWVRDHLLSKVCLVTPNLAEAQRFTGLPCRERDDFVLAGERFLSLGAPTVLVKGGHLSGAAAPDCLLMPGEDPVWLELPRVEGVFRGTGCRLSSAIATRLAAGDDSTEAVRAAKQYLTELLQRQTR